MHLTLGDLHDLHVRAVVALEKRLVGILHGCLAAHVLYDERIAWPVAVPAAA
jgi:hypothetical protein